MPFSLSSRTRFYSFLSLSFLVGIILLWFSLNVLFTQVVQRSNEILKMRKETQFLRERMQYIGFIKNEGLRVERERQVLAVLHPFASGLEFLYFIEKAASDSGGEVRLAVQEGKASVFSAQFSGPFDSLLLFLLRLEATPIEIKVTQVTQGNAQLLLTPSFPKPL